jgi:hypothetical protein
MLVLSGGCTRIALVTGCTAVDFAKTRGLVECQHHDDCCWTHLRMQLKQNKFPYRRDPAE